MGKNKDVTQLVERQRDLEDKLGIRIEALSAMLEVMDEESAYLTVRGEVLPQSGTELDRDIQLVVAVYDRQGRVVGTRRDTIDADEFLGFEVFEIMVLLSGEGLLSRVRIFPVLLT